MKKSVVIEIRETGLHTYSAMACDGRIAAIGTDRNQVIEDIKQRIPPAMLAEGEPEIKIIPSSEPDPTRWLP